MDGLDLDSELIARLYLEQKMSGAALARRFGSSDSTIYARLDDAGVVRSRRTTVPVKEAERLCEEGWSLKRLGIRYGCSDSAVRNALHRHGVRLRSHIDSIQLVSLAFIAGYVDAEGSFGVYSGRGRFKLDSYDVEVLEWVQRLCGKIGVRSLMRCVGRVGTRYGKGTPLNRDLWRININAAPSLLRFIASVDPFLRHERRRTDAARVRLNIDDRLGARVRDREEP